MKNYFHRKISARGTKLAKQALEARGRNHRGSLLGACSIIRGGEKKKKKKFEGPDSANFARAYSARPCRGKTDPRGKNRSQGGGESTAKKKHPKSRILNS